MSKDPIIPIRHIFFKYKVGVGEESGKRTTAVILVGFSRHREDRLAVVVLLRRVKRSLLPVVLCCCRNRVVFVAFFLMIGCVSLTVEIMSFLNHLNAT